ncbi:hypothetical protein DFH27DRAFT_608658 [Peziza echinospora]|nr:hypothetical protein DFH27DRAFT_608658 [Peziza echinospora]
MGGDDAKQKKRKVNTKWKTSYPRMSLLEAEDRLGFRMANNQNDVCEGYVDKSRLYTWRRDSNLEDKGKGRFGKTGRDSVQLLREKEIVSRGGVTGGMEEFVVMDLISVKERNNVLITEAKRSSLGQAMKQCLLSMKDARDSNGGDGASFEMTRKIEVVLEGIDQEKVLLGGGGYSVLVDCMYAALRNGGIVKKDVVVG